MAIVTKLFTDLVKKSDPNDLDVFVLQDGSSGVYYYVVRSDLLNNINLEVFTETEFDNGTVSSGTFTPDCDTKANSHLVTILGDCTIEVPTKTMTGNQMIEAGLTIINGDSYTVSWGTNWDWGDAGEPTLTTKSIIGFKRRAGETKTKAWHHGGYS